MTKIMCLIALLFSLSSYSQDNCNEKTQSQLVAEELVSKSKCVTSVTRAQERISRAYLKKGTTYSWNGSQTVFCERVKTKGHAECLSGVLNGQSEIWQAYIDIGSSYRFSWEDARSYCENLTESQGICVADLYEQAASVSSEGIRKHSYRDILDSNIKSICARK